MQNKIHPIIAFIDSAMSLIMSFAESINKVAESENDQFLRLFFLFIGFSIWTLSLSIKIFLALLKWLISKFITQDP